MENLAHRYCMVQSALTYLDTSGGLQHVRAACIKYNNSEDLLVYHFKLHVDPAELSELNAALGNLMILKPLDASDVFQEVLFQTVQELELLPSDTTLSQIAVAFQLTSLPNPLQRCVIKHVKDLSRSVGRSSYVKFNGIVTGVTGISKYTQSTKYVCPLSECDGNQGNRFIRIHVAGASEKQTIRNDFTCSICGSVLEEDKSSRILSDKLLAEVVPESCFQDTVNYNTRQRLQAVPVCVRDELCEKIQIGQKYHVIGMVRKDKVGETVSLALEANSILKLPCSIPTSLMSSLPESIVCLHSDRRDSPWSFSLSLAYVFGGKISPPGSYLKLKLGLLLSIAAASMERPLHILAIGSEIEIISRLMNYGQQFCERKVSHMVGSHLTGNVIKDGHETAPYFLEGGSLMLAAGGTCCMGDLSRLRKKDTEILQAVLGSNKVFLDLGSKHTGGLPQQSVHPLKCQIWGYSDNKPAKSGKISNDLFTCKEAGNISKSILDVFGCVFFVDTDDIMTREEMDTQTAYQILIQAMDSENSQDRLPVTADEFKQLFKYLSCERTKMTEEAQKLLQMYYLASRKARSDTDTSCGVPVTALQTLKEKMDAMDAIVAADVLRGLLVSHNKAKRQVQLLDQEIKELKTKLEVSSPQCRNALYKHVTELEAVRRMFAVFSSLKWQEVQTYVEEIREALDPNSEHDDVEDDPIEEENDSLAHGHAKLSLRHDVLEEDAVMAIRIYEENLTARFGMSVLNVQPTSHILSQCFEDFIGPDNDKAMQRFHVQLIRFCGAAANMEE